MSKDKNKLVCLGDSSAATLRPRFFLDYLGSPSPETVTLGEIDDYVR